MTDKNNGKYLFADYDEHQKAPIPQLIWKDYHPSGTEHTMTSDTTEEKMQQDIITTKQNNYMNFKLILK